MHPLRSVTATPSVQVQHHNEVTAALLQYKGSQTLKSPHIQQNHIGAFGEAQLRIETQSHSQSSGVFEQALRERAQA